MDMIASQRTGIDQRNYPLNCWWVAAFGQEVGRTPLSRWLLDTPVLLYRTEAGAIVALEDRCPHRQAPLSTGKLQGDTIECGYHGFRFGPNGRCTLVPSMSSPPPIGVETYPTQEIGPVVWIYLGDKAKIDDVPPPPALSWIDHPDFSIRTGMIEVAANYMLLKENVLDLTHFGYVHAASFEIKDWVAAPTVTTDGDTVTYRQEMIRSPLPAPMAAAAGQAPGTPWNRRYFGSFLSPAVQEGAMDLLDPETPDVAMARTRFAHLTTPVDMEHMLYFYIVGRDYMRDDASLDMFAKIVAQGFAEDEAVLEKVQNMISRRPRRGSTGERSVKADAAGVEARRIVDRWMAKETILD